MIIEQDFLCICNHCPHLCVTFEQKNMYANDTIEYREIDVTCEKIDVCRRVLELEKDKTNNAEG